MSAPFQFRDAKDGPSVPAAQQELADTNPLEEGGSAPPQVIAGRYRVEREIGRGGMGKVFLARDLRLQRDVAIKMLAAKTDPRKLERLEYEARLMGSLGHPNVVEVHDIASFDGRPFLVEEYLEGATLRDRLAAGPIPLLEAVETAAQIARALAAAHERSVVHCDMKPENVIVARDGRLKVLDFGIARLTGNAGTGPGETDEGGLFRGTVPYSSPEQLRASGVDARSDVFSLGVVLHEMLARSRPFTGPSEKETARAILHDAPLPLPHGVPTRLQRIVRRTLEKDPGSRYQSAMEVATELGAIAQALRTRARRWRDGIVATIGLALIVGLAIAAVRMRGPPPPKSRQVTFLPGAIWTARFAADGDTVLYTQAFDGPGPRIRSTKIGSPDSQRLESSDGVLLSVSPGGTSALLARPSFAGFDFVGTLTIATPGSAPREVAERASFADWSPDGSGLAIVRRAATGQRLEYPVGTPLFETTGWISEPRVSPDGARVAFIQHPDFASAAGALMVVARDRGAKVVASGFAHARGLSWAPGGAEVWFTASEAPADATSLRATTLDGAQRVLFHSSGDLKLEDVSPQGRVLFTEPRRYIGIAASVSGTESDLSLRDQQVLHDLSADGTLVLFTLSTSAGEGAVFVRKTDGTAAVHIANGYGGALSPDAKWAFVFPVPGRNEGRPALVPVGGGESKILAALGIAVTRARFFPDGTRILLTGQEQGNAPRLYVLSLAGGPPRPISDAGVSPAFAAVSPSGALVASLDSRGSLVLFPVAGGAFRPVPLALDGEVPLGWSDEGVLLVGRPLAFPLQIDRIDLAANRRAPWKTIRPASTGAAAIARILFARDPDRYAYSQISWNTHLYVLDGLH